MSIQKKSLISTLKTTKKANVAKDTFEAAPASGKMAGRTLGKTAGRTLGKTAGRTLGKTAGRTLAQIN